MSGRGPRAASERWPMQPHVRRFRLHSGLGRLAGAWVAGADVPGLRGPRRLPAAPQGLVRLPEGRAAGRPHWLHSRPRSVQAAGCRHPLVLTRGEIRGLHFLSLCLRKTLYKRINMGLNLFLIHGLQKRTHRIPLFARMQAVGGGSARLPGAGGPGPLLASAALAVAPVHMAGLGPFCGGKTRAVLMLTRLLGSWRRALGQNNRFLEFDFALKGAPPGRM